jgi:5,10-methylenetetrahydromethanopterin reductase
MSTLEFGLSIRPASPAEDLPNVVTAEEQGFDTALFGDSQNAFASPFVRMGAATQATSTIKLATCGVPCSTRHPAMAAGEALTVHVYSGGRAVLGLARGDSALGMLGRRVPARLAEFEPFARDVRAYLQGDAVDLDGYASRMTWRPKGLSPVPVDLACSGPNAIRQAARIADRVSFSVGTDPDRIAWALGVARAEIAAAGRDPEEVQFGCYANVMVSDDVEAAAVAMCNPIAYSAHFNAMAETRVQDHPPELRRVTEPLREAFLTRERTPPECVDPEFARWWGAVGTVDDVRAKLAGVVDQGIRHVYLLNGAGSVPEMTVASQASLAADVLPWLRERAV